MQPAAASAAPRPRSSRDRPHPVSTYRLQVTGAFDLHAAAELTDYLADLGADWVYLSPLLQAARARPRLRRDLPRRASTPPAAATTGLRALSAAARAAGLGVLVDIVPNHMGVATPAKNAWWWDVLEHGRESRYATRSTSTGTRRRRLRSRRDSAARMTGALSTRPFPHRGRRAPDGHDRQHYELTTGARTPT